ncbi:MAG: ABC transporter substrate-binding protein [Chloroflexota bacterium]
MPFRRRGWLQSGTALAVAGCVRSPDRRAGIVAYPARSLIYAPLLVAQQHGLYAAPPVHVVPLLRSGGRQVAAEVASGKADAGALPLADFLEAAAAGAPLVTFGALTRRFGGQLVVSATAAFPREVGALLSGEWRAAPVGLQTGSGGSEQMMRFWWLAEGPTPLAPLPTGEGGTPAAASAKSGLPSPLVGAGGRFPLLISDPLAGEPRWIGYGTSEGLVAALKDHRIDAFLGHSQAAAQAAILGGADIIASFSDGSVAPDVSSTLGTVLVARRERLAGRNPAGDQFMHALVRGCARAAATLVGPDGPAAASRALPERDPLTLGLALRLDAPAESQSIYALDGRLDPEAIGRYLQLAALAGHTHDVEPAALITDRYTD